jgi:hypothetical protein
LSRTFAERIPSIPRLARWASVFNGMSFAAPHPQQT